MSGTRPSYPLFSRGDLNAFWALFADNLANMIIVSVLCTTVLNMPVGLVFFLGAMFGMMAFLHHLIPVAAVAPMLVFVAIVITGQAFVASPPAHAIAVAVAMIPHVSNLLVSKWNALVNVLGDGAVTLTDRATAAAMKLEGAHVAGHSALANGSIIIGMLWGYLVVAGICGLLRLATPRAESRGPGADSPPAA